MSIAAVASAPGDFAELQGRAVEVERHRYVPSQFDKARAALELLINAAMHWDQLDEPRRDVLRHLVNKLDEEQKPSRLARMTNVFRVFIYASRYGTERMYREAHQLIEACARFRSIVLAAEERNNEELQSALAEAINSALTTSSTTRLSRGQVGEWIKRIPY